MTCRNVHHHKIMAMIAAIMLLAVAVVCQAAGTMPESFAELAQKEGPTVVNIYTTQTVKAPQGMHRFLFPDDQDVPEPFRRFFGLPSMPGERPQREFKRTSLGSGVITSRDGFILTNNHVVQDADEISVTLSSNEEYEAKVIGRDPKTDIALIKIEPKHDLPSVVFGDSDKLQVGDWVLAIGNPFGLEQTVTAGIVSAKGRSISNGGYGNFIQTDASINPGNSGGGLFNLKGEMVGVNTAIFSQSGGNIGIGFAIPVNMAKNVMQQLKEHGKVVRGWLGVMIQQVTPELARNFGMERAIGALVGEVTPDSPADKAGIKQGDVIIKYNGQEVSQMGMLPAWVAQTPVGDKADVVLIRDKKEKEVSVTIAALKEEESAEGGEEAAHSTKLGMTIQDITPELAQTLSVKPGQGVLVSDVAQNSASENAGVRQGDIILELNRTRISSVSQFNSLVHKLKEKENVLLLIKRGDHTLFVGIKSK